MHFISPLPRLSTAALWAMFPLFILSTGLLPGAVHGAITTEMATTDDPHVQLAHNDSCPAYDMLDYTLRSQCPPFEDRRCVVNLPCDKKTSALLNCATADAQSSPALRVLNATQLLEMLRHRDPYGRPWCMLTFFYSPKCYFSAKIARNMLMVASLFPRLQVVALDVAALGVAGTDGLITQQFGITSTPTLALWEDGLPRYRMLDDYSQIEKLTSTITSRTDLTSSEQTTPLTPPNESHEGYKEEAVVTHSPSSKNDFQLEFLAQFEYLDREGEAGSGSDPYLWLAAAALLVNVLYFAFFAPCSPAVLQRYLHKVGTIPHLKRDA